MRTTKKFLALGVAGALTTLGLFAGSITPAGAIQRDCSNVGHHTPGAQYDTWLTPGEHDTTPDLLDAVDENGTATTITSDTALPAGYMVRGWLHICATLTGRYVGIVRFRDTAENPNWNDRGPNMLMTPALGTDVVIGAFYQVVPNETIKPFGFFLQGKLEQFENTLFLSPEFHVILGDSVVAPPGNVDGPANTSCAKKGGFTAQLLDGQVMDVKPNHDGTHRQVPIYRGDMVAQDALLNGNINYCSYDKGRHTVAIKLVPVSPEAITSAWEAAFFTDGNFTRQLQRAGGFYQQAPDEPGLTFELLARIIDQPGGSPDESDMAQDAPFPFTICDIFDGVTCK